MKCIERSCGKKGSRLRRYLSGNCNELLRKGETVFNVTYFVSY